jgi:hypothetical protein
MLNSWHGTLMKASTSIAPRKCNVCKRMAKDRGTTSIATISRYFAFNSKGFALL